ncbi:MAG TPA: NosD domain-containing protein [Candidatus Bathyarchaeia archaeon]|nr:NosD domain-containing protein [Candidatus Bathyarchaeia archaeon]
MSILVISTELAHGKGSFWTSTLNHASEISSSTAADASSGRVFLNQTFESETVGATPTGWNVLYPQYGNITVVNNTWYGPASTGKSVKITDEYVSNNPVPYKLFPEQINTVAISFSIKPTSNMGAKGTIEVYVDDSNFNGANIVFTGGKIGHRTKYGVLYPLRDSYAPDRWYKIKMILNVPRNLYAIYIDDHLEKTNAEFTGTATQIHRIALNETSGQEDTPLPVAFIDEIFGLKGIEIPKDYPDIQQGVNAASEGDLVFVDKQSYFESLIVPATKNGIWLYGEASNTTIIDGRFFDTKNGITIQASNVRMSGFTMYATSGTGIVIEGSNNTIENTIVTNGLRDGIHITAPNNTVSDSIITKNLQCGIRVEHSNTTLSNDIIELNDEHGIIVTGWNSVLEDSTMNSNLQTGILISQGEQNLIRNNTMTKNGIGIKCDINGKNNDIYSNRLVNNTVQAYNYDESNKWDDGYPYVPDQKGGGNYWCDFNSSDIYSGKDQDQPAYCLLPSPDGICDQPYLLSPVGTDSYPLFLIQNITVHPQDLEKINYTTLVNVTATVLKSVNITEAHLEIEYDSVRRNISMTIGGNKLRGTIPALKYGTQVRFNVTAHVDSAELLARSTNYPLKGPYIIGDHLGPTIGAPVINPATPDVNQTILVTANVTEPENASGVGYVTVAWLFQGSPIWEYMNFTGNNSYSATIPPQSWGGTLNITISAIDKAGNLNSRPPLAMLIKKLPELTVIYKNVTVQEPCNIDLGVMYRGEKRVDSNLRLNNTGGEVLSWRIELVKDGNWVKISPSNGTTAPGSSNVTVISVDTTGLDTNSYAAEFVAINNGSIPRYVIIVRITVRDIVIDESYASVEDPKRSDVNENQFFGFHATWAHNGTNAVSGKIRVRGIGWLDVNATGWVNFNDSSPDPVGRIYYVEEVNFTETRSGQVYFVRSFTQNAANRTTIWDRIKVVLAFLDDRINVNSEGFLLTNGSVYEYDNSSFKGTVYLNDTLFKNNVGKYYFATSFIVDANYGLNAFSSNTVPCIWDRVKIIGGGPSQKQTPIGNNEEVGFIAIYEYDNILLKGANGTLFVGTYEFNQSVRAWQLRTSDEPMEWSAEEDLWAETFSFKTQGSRRFGVTKVEDRIYGLTAIQNLEDLPEIAWIGSGWAWPTTANSQPIPVQNGIMPWWAVISIALTLTFGMTATVIIWFKSRKNGRAKANYNSHRR